ncbi:unnamed protein product [Sympodiomycopsis kandeliae]
MPAGRLQIPRLKFTQVALHAVEMVSGSKDGTESNGILNHARAENGFSATKNGEHFGSRRSHFEDLPIELLCKIYRHLSYKSLSSLYQVCKHLNHSVNQYGWTIWVTKRPKLLSILNSSTKEDTPYTKQDVSRIIKINQSWRLKSIRCKQVHFHTLPYPVGLSKNNRKPLTYQMQLKYNTAIPILAMTARGLFMAFKSFICIWQDATLASSDGVTKSPPSIVHLFERKDAGDDAWLDISCFQIIEPSTEGKHLLAVIGRVNGDLEIWSLNLDQCDAKLIYTMSSSEDTSRSSSHQTVQSMSFLSHCNLLAVAWKSGQVALFDLSHIVSSDLDVVIKEESSPLPLQSVRSWDVNSRPWSIHLGMYSTSPFNPWLAVGCQGVDFLFLYPEPLQQQGQEGSSAPDCHSLRTSYSETPPHLSTYALASSRLPHLLDKKLFPTNHLYAGCYDGMVRVWDVEQVAKQSRSSKDIEDPSSSSPPIGVPLTERYVDRYDPSPVYSIALGVGLNSQCIAAGTARFGIVKVFRIGQDSQRDRGKRSLLHHDTNSSESDDEELDAEIKREEDLDPDEGCSFYPPAPRGDFPTYSIVGEHGRLFHVGQGRIFEMDSRAHASVDGEQSVGWYYHGQMELRRTGDRGSVRMVTQ